MGWKVIRFLDAGESHREMLVSMARRMPSYIIIDRPLVNIEEIMVNYRNYLGYLRRRQA